MAGEHYVKKIEVQVGKQDYSVFVSRIDIDEKNREITLRVQEIINANTAIPVSLKSPIAKKIIREAKKQYERDQKADEEA